MSWVAYQVSLCKRGWFRSGKCSSADCSSMLAALLRSHGCWHSTLRMCCCACCGVAVCSLCGWSMPHGLCAIVCGRRECVVVLLYCCCVWLDFIVAYSGKCCGCSEQEGLLVRTEGFYREALRGLGASVPPAFPLRTVYVPYCVGSAMKAWYSSTRSAKCLHFSRQFLPAMLGRMIALAIVLLTPLAVSLGL
jgi:hypothetical protein